MTQPRAQVLPGSPSGPEVSVPGCWLKPRDASGDVFVDLSPAGLDATDIPLGSAVEVTGVIGKTREGKIGFIASHVEALEKRAAQ